jgi:hypothetical protein
LAFDGRVDLKRDPKPGAVCRDLQVVLGYGSKDRGRPLLSEYFSETVLFEISFSLNSSLNPNTFYNMSCNSQD